MISPGRRLSGSCVKADPLQEIGKLDEISQQFAAELFKAFPEWRDFAQVKSNEHDGGHYLHVEMPPPATSDLQRGFWVTAEAGEVVAGFDLTHAHFDWPPNDYPNPFEFFADVFAE